MSITVTVVGAAISLSVASAAASVSVAGQQGPAGPPISGTNKQVLFFDGDSPAGNAAFTFDKATGKVSSTLLANTSNAGALTLFGVQAASNALIGFTSTTDGTGVPDTGFRRESVGVIGQYNGTTAQVFNLYGTRPDAGNYTRLALRNDGLGVFELSAQQAGTGVAQALRIKTTGAQPIYLAAGEVDRWTIASSGHLHTANDDNALDVGTVGRRPRTGRFGTSVETPRVGDTGGKWAIGLRTAAPAGGGQLLLTRPGDGFGWTIYPDASNSLTFVTGSGSETTRATWTDSGVFSLFGTHHVYNAGSTPAGVIERLYVGFAANVAYVATEAAGGGVSRSLVLGGQTVVIAGPGGASTRWTFDTSGHFLPSGGCNIGSTASRVPNIYTTNVDANGAVTITGAGSVTVPQLSLAGTGNNWIGWNTSGAGAPTAGTRSLGTKLVLFPNPGAVEYARGIEGGGMWDSVPTTAEAFHWYAGTARAATLTGAGNLTLTGNLDLYNGASARSVYAYFFRTDASNWERLKMGWDVSLGFFVGAEWAGTGAQEDITLSGRYVRMISGGSERWRVQNADFVPLVDVGANIGSPSARIANGHFGGFVAARQIAASGAYANPGAQAVNLYMSGTLGVLANLSTGGTPAGEQRVIGTSVTVATGASGVVCWTWDASSNASGTGTLSIAGTIKTGVYTVATLPAAATAGVSARALVTDSSVTASGNFGVVVASGGANSVPVYSDGTNWRIG